MSKIIFINPSMDKILGMPTWSSPLATIMKGNRNTLMPKLVAMVFAALTPEKHTFSYIEEEFEDQDAIQYDKMDADLVAITSLTIQAYRAYEIAGEFRKRGIPVVIGGIHATVVTSEVAKHCDTVMIGEGENTWTALLEDFEKGKMKKVYNAKDYPPVEVLTSPKVDIIKHERYLSYPIQATKGCPYNCDFCSIEYSSGHKYRMKPVEQVINEIKEYEKYNKPIVIGASKKSYLFVDDNLYVNREYLKELFTAMKGLNIRWDGQGSVNTTKDEEIMQLMAESGCRSLAIGFESISQESLKEANKPRINVVNEYTAAVHNLQKYGIIAMGYFIFGFDSDDVSVFKETYNFITESNVVQPIFSMLTPYPGTKLYDRMSQAERIYNDGTWTAYNSWACVFTPKKMSAYELQAGFTWILAEAISVKNLKENFKRFWAKGPWKTTPPLTTIERIALIYLGIKMSLLGYRKYGMFLIWATTQKKAADFQSIIWMMMRYELVENLRNTYSPKRKK